MITQAQFDMDPSLIPLLLESIPDRGPRDPEDDHSQNTEERDDMTDEEREEWIYERDH